MTGSIARKIRIDITLLSCIILLIGIGFGFLYSASQPSAIKYYDNPYYYIIKQGIYLLIGLFSFLAGFFIPLKVYTKYIKIITIGTIILLIITLLPFISKEVGGARRWIVLGAFQFQPSEIAKLVVIIYLSSVLSRKEEALNDFYRAVLPPLLIVGLISILVFLENDFSTTFLIICNTMVMFFLAGINILSILLMMTAGGLSAFLMIFFAPFRITRIFAFLNPWEDPQGAGWHYIQSMKCFALGKWFGKGIGESQQKYYALPEAHNDYIFAIIGEEGGAFFAIIILVLFSVFVFVGSNIAKLAKDSFSYLLASGITAMIFIQAMVNIGVVIGILPATGVTLPFVSSGGTSLVIFLFATGMLMQIGWNGSSDANSSSKGGTV